MTTMLMAVSARPCGCCCECDIKMAGKDSKKQAVPDPAARRLPRYYRYVNDLYHNGVVRVSSTSLGGKMGITASQVRQDFNHFGGFGYQGYGYDVGELRSQISRLLGLENHYRAVVVGAGNLGQALMQNFQFHDIGFGLEVAFDIAPVLVGTEINGIPILPLGELESYVSSHKPHVAVLTVPQSAAQSVADRLVRSGIRGIWNFTNAELATSSGDVCIEDVHLADSLLTLSYHING